MHINTIIINLSGAVIRVKYCYWNIYIYRPNVYEFGPGRGKFRKSPVISS